MTELQPNKVEVLRKLAYKLAAESMRHKNNRVTTSRPAAAANQPAADQSAADQPAAKEGAKRKRGRKPSEKSLLFDELDSMGASALQFSEFLTQHKIEHTIPQGKALGRGLTSSGKLKLMVNNLNDEQIPALIAEVKALADDYFIKCE